jgi:hypothetical protein
VTWTQSYVELAFASETGRIPLSNVLYAYLVAG